MKKFIAFLIVVLIGMQFISVERTNPPIQGEIIAPANIKEILKKACYDCHSNETNWAWYSKVAPISYLVVSQVNHAREQLNFSEWDLTKEQKHREEIWDQIREEQMPPWTYRVLNSDAKLSQQEKDALRVWATGK